MLAGEQRAILDRHAAAGTGNPATDRTQPTGGAWVEGEMNALASATGVTYQTRIVGTEITLDAALDVLQTNLTAFLYLQDLYIQINAAAPQLVETQCPTCGARFAIDVGVGEMTG